MVFWLRSVCIRSVCIGKQNVLVLVSVRGTLAQCSKCLAGVKALATQTCEACLLTASAVVC